MVIPCSSSKNRLFLTLFTAIAGVNVSIIVQTSQRMKCTTQHQEDQSNEFQGCIGAKDRILGAKKINNVYGLP